MLYLCQTEGFKIKSWICTHIQQATRHQVSKSFKLFEDLVTMQVQAERGGKRSALAGLILAIAG